MLDVFMEVLHSQDMKKQASRELVETLKLLPSQELFDLANGNPSGAIKLAYLGDPSCDWLTKYKGTPLFDQAVALEEQLLQIEAQEQQQRAVDRQNQQLWEERDRLCLQKRVLDLQLVQAQEPRAGADLEEAETAGLELATQAHETEQAQQNVAPPTPPPQAPPQAQQPPAPKGPPQGEEQKEKEASLRARMIHMDKLARQMARADAEKLGADFGRSMAMPAVSTALGGGMGALAGHLEGGEAAEGALRGAAGGAGGALLGGVGARALAGLSVVPDAYRAIRKGRASGNVDLAAIRSALLPRAQQRGELLEPYGQAVGGGLGYNHTLSKYINPPQEPVEEKTPVATKEAALGPTIAAAGKNMLSGAKAAIPGVTAGAQRLGSAAQNGGLTGGLKAMGRMGANFAQKNPLAAAGIAGGAGLLAGSAMS